MLLHAIECLCKPHKHFRRLRPGGGAARLQGAVIDAVDKGIAVGPGHGGLVPVIQQVGEVGSPTPLRLALQVVEDLHGLGPSQALAGHEGGGAGTLHTLRFCFTPTARAKALPFSPILRYTKPSKTIAR